MNGEQTQGPDGWVDRHGDCLYRYAMMRLKVPDQAADVVQETFLEALRARGSFAGRSNERTWLIGILKHKIIDHFRKSSREQTTSRPAALDAVPEPWFDRRGRWQAGLASWGGDPSRALETQEFWDVFHRCLSKLPPGLADAFFLRELDGLSAAEVQDVLGITAPNLWARLHRARSSLRQCLAIGWFGRQPSSPP